MSLLQSSVSHVALGKFLLHATLPISRRVDTTGTLRAQVHAEGRIAEEHYFAFMYKAWKGICHHNRCNFQLRSRHLSNPS